MDPDLIKAIQIVTELDDRTSDYAMAHNVANDPSVYDRLPHFWVTWTPVTLAIGFDAECLWEDQNTPFELEYNNIVDAYRERILNMAEVLPELSRI